jgi:type IV pilus assembly protein PilC
VTLLNSNATFKFLRRKEVKELKEFTNFSYKGVDLWDKPISGVISAKNRSEARYMLERDGYSNLQINEKTDWWNFEIGRTVSLETLLQTTRQLASFSEAGIPAAKGIEILSNTSNDKKMREVLADVLTEVEGGANLSEAVMQHPNVFPRYYGAILTAAERSGNLTQALTTLNSYLERDVRSKRAVRSAMIYPAVLVTLSFVAVTVLSVFVLPRFQIFFTSLGVNLPLTTRILLVVTHFVAKWWWAILLLIISAIVGIIAMRKNPTGRFTLDALILRLPVAGSLIKLVALERFCRVLSTLVKTHVHLPEALELAGNSTGNVVFENAIKSARTKVLQGEGLAAPLESANIFPSAAIQIFRIGEESGQLGSQLHQAAAFYSDELDHRLKNFTALLEPATLLFIGGGVGFVAVALVSAMYGIYQGVHA